MSTHEPLFVGLDFGTTNSALAIGRGADPPALVPLPHPGGARSVCRTVLFFEQGEGPLDLDLHIGGAAIERFVATGGEGRLIQSIKSHLASPHFNRTRVFERMMTLEDIVGAFLRRLRAVSPVDPGRRAVVGRPVRYWGARDEEDEARAIRRMEGALKLAGFEEVVFEYEPSAAALEYAARLDHDELVLIADFGGGTSDFTLIRVGPGVEPGDPHSVLGTSGMGIGGDTFDGRLIGQVVAPALGRGTRWRTAHGAMMPVPSWIYDKLGRWHHLSFLRSPETIALLIDVRRTAEDRAAISGLLHLIDHELGYALHRSVEQTKVALSSAARAMFEFDPETLSLIRDVLTPDFERWISPDLDQLDTVVTGLMDQAGVSSGDVDRVFTTGGSSLVPAVRSRLAGRFGAEKLAGGGELTSVATGLAHRARTVF